MSFAAKHVSAVAAATLLSRVFGLVRDILLFAGLGAGPALSAFVVAFTLPNLFRRMLGEGALTSAVVPVLANSLEKDGPEESFALLNAVLTRLVALLVVVAVGGGIVLLAVTSTAEFAQRWELAGRLSVLLLPYSILICVAAMLAAQLNVMHRFLVPGLSPVWLNLAMIGALGAGLLMPGWTPLERVVVLSLAVLLGGLWQAFVPALALRREGWRPRLAQRRSTALDEVWRLLLPGLVGAAVLQVNLLLSRLLAFSIDDAAASVLYLANRLIELPYGVFAVAITTVAFPQMARAVAAADTSAFGAAYARGRGTIWLITLPAAVGLAILAEPILLTLFQWGLFDAADVRRTVLPLQVMAAGLPFFSWTILATRGLHSWKEMRLPVRFAIVNAVLNLGLSLALMPFWKEVGLAAANVCAGIVLTVFLERALAQRRVITFGMPGWWGLGRMLLASALMAAVLFPWRGVVEGWMPDPKVGALVVVLGGIPLGMLVYFLACALLRVRELAVVAELLGGRKRRPAAGV